MLRMEDRVHLKGGLGLGRHPQCPSYSTPQTRLLQLKDDRGRAAGRTPLRMAGAVVPALAFLNGSLSKILILPLAVALALHFKPAPQE